MQVADGLYSPQVESEQFESITAQVGKVINSFMDNLFIQQVEVSHRMCVHVCGCVFEGWHVIGYGAAVYV